MDFKIINATTLTLEMRRQKEIEQLEALLAVREHNARITERFLRMFGKCKPAEWVQERKQHLMRAIESVREMRSELERLKVSSSGQIAVLDI